MRVLLYAFVVTISLAFLLVKGQASTKDAGIKEAQAQPSEKASAESGEAVAEASAPATDGAAGADAAADAGAREQDKEKAEGKAGIKKCDCFHWDPVCAQVSLTFSSPCHAKGWKCTHPGLNSSIIIEEGACPCKKATT